MLKWIALGLLVTVLGASGWLYLNADIANFTRYVDMAANSEPQCQAPGVVEAMFGNGDAERASRRAKMRRIVVIRFVPSPQMMTGRLWRGLSRDLWARTFVSDSELARAACALGNGGGPDKNLPRLARIVAARDLASLDPFQRTALMSLYFGDLQGSLPVPLIRERFSIQLKRAHASPGA